MNRRSFLNQLLLGGTAFTILPGAGRIWKAKKEPLFRCVILPRYPCDQQTFVDAFFYNAKAIVLNGKPWHELSIPNYDDSAD